LEGSLSVRALNLGWILVLMATLAWTQTDAASPSAPSPPTSVASDSTSSPLTATDLETKLKFRSESILVQVPVIVTQKNGSHIHGLTKNEIHVFEDGKERPISVFEEKIVSQSPLPDAAVKPGEFRNLVISDGEVRPVTIIALDTVNTPYLDQETGRKEVVRFLADSLNSGQLTSLMLMTREGLKIVQPLTGDPMRLVRVLKQVTGEQDALQGVNADTKFGIATGNISPPPPITPFINPGQAMARFIDFGDTRSGTFVQQEAIETTLHSLQSVAWAFSGIPGRKSLIWATGGLPFEMYSPNSLPSGFLSILFQRTIQALAEAQISVYPVDVRGLPSLFSVRDSPRSLSDRTWLQGASESTLDQFAEMTGGKAFYNTNDLASSLKRAADDAASYYLVGYYLDTRNRKAGWRTIKVRVDRSDSEVRARKGFFVTNATMKTELTRRSDISYALASPIDGTGVPITMKWLGVAGNGSAKKATFVVQMPPMGLAFDTAAQNHLDFDFAVAAYIANGQSAKPAVTLGKNFSPTLTEPQLVTVRAKGVGFNYDLDLSPGQYAVRLVVRDNVSGKIGSVTVPLTVN
jgi:VWFA-related protein